MISVFGDELSGNCLKVKWVLDHLAKPYIWTHVDITKGESRTPAFLAMNPAGQVPTVRLEDGRMLSQSNAILLYLARGSALEPTEPFAQAQVHEWMFWEQYSHEPYIAVRRFQKLYLGKSEAEIEPRLMERGAAALGRMEAHLRDHSVLVGGTMTVADICLLPYTRFAPEGGFDLKPYPSVANWVDRVSAALELAGNRP